MEFLTFVKANEKNRREPPPAALMEAMGKFVQKSFAGDVGGLRDGGVRMGRAVLGGR